MVSKGRWADLPTELKDDLDRRVADKKALKRLERQRRRSLKAQLKREGKVVVVGLDRVQTSKIQRTSLQACERCRVLRVELDRLMGRRRRGWNQRETLELAIGELEAVLRRKLLELVDLEPGLRGRVDKVLGWEPANCLASQREGDQVVKSPPTSNTSHNRTTNGTAR